MARKHSNIGAYWTVSKTETENLEQLKGENSRLREELEQRDRLLQQLSLKLFRLVQDNTNFIVEPEDTSHSDEKSRGLLREKFQELEKQVIFYQQEIVVRDGEIYQLRESYQELTNHSQMLEEVIRELPIIYQRKFAERLAPVQETMKGYKGKTYNCSKNYKRFVTK